MEFADALVADQLWGWPVTLLDHLRELRRQAWEGEISVEEWREHDAASRAGLEQFVQRDYDDAEDNNYGRSLLAGHYGCQTRASRKIVSADLPVPSARPPSV